MTSIPVLHRIDGYFKLQNVTIATDINGHSMAIDIICSIIAPNYIEIMGKFVFILI